MKRLTIQILEVFHQPVGYRPGEEYATHSRRRFRLMPPKVPNPNAPQVDPSLWLVHYGPADERDPIPVKKIRLEPRLRTILEQRNNLQRAGQITRKEFMLSDRVNWPQIPLPRDARGPPGYPGGVPQQMAYPPHPGGNLPPPPSKRARHAASAAGHHGHHGPPAMPPGPPGGAPQHMVPAPPMDVALYEDEEDYSRGDMFDAITPRDVSLERYKQNHEWMEEVISSPYRIGQIGYADLGLGLKGELAGVTDGIFESQAFDAFQRVPKKPYVGRLDGGLAEAFRKRVTEKIAATNAEIAEMTAQHEKLMASLHVNSVIKKGEHDLRFATATEGTGPEIWRIEGRLDSDEAGNNGNEAGSGGSGSGSDGHWSHEKHHKTVDEVLTQVEQTLGRKVSPAAVVVRVQDGGYKEPTPEPEPVPEPEAVEAASLEVPLISAPGGGAGAPGSVSLSQHPSPAGSQLSGIMIGDADMDMGDTAAMLDQMESVFSPASTPVNFPTPTAAPAAATGLSHVAMPGGGPAQPQPPAPAAGAGPSTIAAAVAVGGGQGGGPSDAAMADSAAASNDDWVVVPPGGGVSPSAAVAAPAALPVGPPGGAVAAAKSPAATGTDAAAGAGVAAAVPAAPGSSDLAVPTPGADNDFASLTGIDDGLDLNMDMEDSAFGDAFHGSDS